LKHLEHCELLFESICCWLVFVHSLRRLSEWGAAVRRVLRSNCSLRVTCRVLQSTLCSSRDLSTEKAIAWKCARRHRKCEHIPSIYARRR
jgi:hypothetical protein